MINKLISSRLPGKVLYTIAVKKKNIAAQHIKLFVPIQRSEMHDEDNHAKMRKMQTMDLERRHRFQQKWERYTQSKGKHKKGTGEC